MLDHNRNSTPLTRPETLTQGMELLQQAETHADRLLFTTLILDIVVAMLTALYIVSPIDAVPDVVPVLGLADDVLVFFGGLTMMAFITLIGFIMWARERQRRGEHA